MHCNSAPPEGLTEDGGRGGWSYTRINSADGNAVEGGAAGSVKPSWILGRVGVCREGRGILRFTAPKHQCPHVTPVQLSQGLPGLPWSRGLLSRTTAMAGSRPGCAREGDGRSRRSDRGWCRSPAFTLCSERQPRDPRLRHSSVSLESGNKMMGQGLCGGSSQRSSLVISNYPCPARPRRPFHQELRRSVLQTRSTSITADAHEGAERNLHAQRPLKMRSNKKTTTHNSPGASDRCAPKSPCTLNLQVGQASPGEAGVEAGQQGRI